MSEPAERARALWSAGDYPRVAKRFEPLADELLEAVGSVAASRLLDVAAGTGNVALAAARLGATITAADITPRMLELGRARCAAVGVDIDWRLADAAALPFSDGEFDVVTSCLGVIFAPDPEVVIDEVARVLRPGGRLGLVTWGLDAGRHRQAGVPLEVWLCRVRGRVLPHRLADSCHRPQHAERRR